MPHVHSYAKRLERSHRAVIRGYIRSRRPIGVSPVPPLSAVVPTAYKRRYLAQCKVACTAIATNMLLSAFGFAAQNLGKAIVKLRSCVTPPLCGALLRMNRAYNQVRHQPLARRLPQLQDGLVSRLRVTLFACVRAGNAMHPAFTGQFSGHYAAGILCIQQAVRRWLSRGAHFARQEGLPLVMLKAEASHGEPDKALGLYVQLVPGRGSPTNSPRPFRRCIGRDLGRVYTCSLHWWLRRRRLRRSQRLRRLRRRQHARELDCCSDSYSSRSSSCSRSSNSRGAKGDKLSQRDLKRLYDRICEITDAQRGMRGADDLSEGSSSTSSKNQNPL